MSYELERIAITNFLKDQDFFDLKDFGLDRDDFKAKNNSGYMQILSGESGVTSIGGPKSRVITTSVLQIIFYLETGRGSSAARTKAQEIVDALFDRKLDENGILSSNSSKIVIDFGANGFVPYISYMQNEASHIRTVVSASFTTSQLKQRT